MNEQGRFAVIPAAWLEREDMDPASIVVLCVLASYANRDGWCWPRQDRIAKVARRSQPWVAEAIKRLTDAGLIETKRTQTGNKYRLLLDRGLSAYQPADMENQPADIRHQPADMHIEQYQRTKPKNTYPSDRTPKRKVGLPEGFPGAEQIAWSIAEYPAFEWEQEINKFRDRAIRDGAAYKDWPAAWRTWCHNAVKWAPKPSSNAKKNGWAKFMEDAGRG